VGQQCARYRGYDNELSGQ